MDPKDKNENNELQRFTTLIEPKLLSNIKLISYFTNQKLYETINNSIELYVKEFETNNKTSISSIINLKEKFSQNESEKVPQSSPLNPKKED